MWRYTSISDLLNIIKASCVSSLIIVCLILFSHSRFIGFPRSVFIMDWCFTILLISGYRLSIRLYFERMSNDKTSTIPTRQVLTMFFKKMAETKRLLIIGAGNGGEKIYREIQDNARLQYTVIGFLDDDLAKVGKTIHGIPVLGRIEDIKRIAKKVNADEALIAIPSATSEQMREILTYCRKSGIEFKTIPGIGDILALVIIYEIHRIDRFPTVNDFASYARLVRVTKTSAGKSCGTSSKKIGNVYLKWAFSEAACLMLRDCKPAQKFKQKLERRQPKSKALGTLTHKLGRTVYYMLKRHPMFDVDRCFAA